MSLYMLADGIAFVVQVWTLWLFWSWHIAPMGVPALTLQRALAFRVALTVVLGWAYNPRTVPDRPRKADDDAIAEGIGRAVAVTGLTLVGLLICWVLR